MIWPTEATCQRNDASCFRILLETSQRGCLGRDERGLRLDAKPCQLLRRGETPGGARVLGTRSITAARAGRRARRGRAPGLQPAMDLPRRAAEALGTNLLPEGSRLSSPCAPALDGSYGLQRLLLFSWMVRNLQGNACALLPIGLLRTAELHCEVVGAYAVQRHHFNLPDGLGTTLALKVHLYL